MFEERNPYKLNKLLEMKDRCSKCGLVYEMEPSFFYGAMYVNYALTVAISVGVFLAMYLLFDGFEMTDYLIGIISALFITAPMTYRIGRMVWINMFVSYKADAQDERKQ